MVIQQQIISNVHHQKLRQFSAQQAANALAVGSGETVLGIDSEKLSPIKHCPLKVMNNEFGNIIAVPVVSPVRATKKRRYNKVEYDKQLPNAMYFSNEKQAKIAVDNDNAVRKNLLSNFITQQQQQQIANSRLTQDQSAKSADFMTSLIPESFATPPPSHPPASSLLSPGVANIGNGTSTAINFHANQQQQQLVAELVAAGVVPEASSILLTSPEAHQSLKERLFAIDETQLQNNALASFLSPVTHHQQQQQQHHQKQLVVLPNSETSVMINANDTTSATSTAAAASSSSSSTTNTANYQTGTSLALNELIGNSSIYSSPAALSQQLQKEGQTQQSPQQQQLLTNNGTPVSTTTLLAFLQQQQQLKQMPGLDAAQAMLMQLVIQKELQRQQLQQIIAAAVQLQQQQVMSKLSPQTYSLLQQTIQEQPQNSVVFPNSESGALNYQKQSVQFLAPPLTHTPMSLIDDLSTASPSFLVSTNVSCSSTLQQPSAAKLAQFGINSNVQTELKRFENITTSTNDLDAFERAIAQEHGDLTDRESLAVAVLAAGLTDSI